MPKDQRKQVIIYFCEKCSYKSNLVASNSFITITESHADLNLNWLES